MFLVYLEDGKNKWDDEYQSIDISSAMQIAKYCIENEMLNPTVLKILEVDSHYEDISEYSQNNIANFQNSLDLCIKQSIEDDKYENSDTYHNNLESMR